MADPSNHQDHRQLIKLLYPVQARFYEKPGTNICAAFLANNDTKNAQTINFRGREYLLPPRSISILPDCNTVVYNTQTVKFLSHENLLTGSLMK